MPDSDDLEICRTDEAILQELDECHLEYVAIIANRRGLNLSYTERRCRKLERYGFVEKTSDEVTYRITPKGEQYVDIE